MEKQWKQRLYFLGGSKITADGDRSHEIKRLLLLGRKAMTNLDRILKSRDINFANKGPSSQSYGFSSSHVWMFLKVKVTQLCLTLCDTSESLTIKKSEC